MPLRSIIPTLIGRALELGGKGWGIGVPPTMKAVGLLGGSGTTAKFQASFITSVPLKVSRSLLAMVCAESFWLICTSTKVVLMLPRRYTRLARNGPALVAVP